MSTSSTKQQTIFDFVTANNNTPFDDHCETKYKGITKIILQNTNGLDLGSNALTTRELIYNYTRRDANVCCLVETNANYKNKEAKENINNYSPRHGNHFSQ